MQQDITNPYVAQRNNNINNEQQVKKQTAVRLFKHLNLLAGSVETSPSQSVKIIKIKLRDASAGFSLTHRHTSYQIMIFKTPTRP